MKKLLLCAAVASTAFFGYAEDVVLDSKDATNIKGTLVEETKKDDGTVQAAKHYQPLESLEINGWSFTFTSGANKSTAPAYYYPTSTNTSGKTSIRIYKDNEMTITAPADTYFTKIVYVADNNTKEVELWSGEATNELNSVPTGTCRLNQITITLGKQGEEPPVSDVVLQNDFQSTLDPFTVENKIENAYTGWKLNGSPKCAIANSYLSDSKTNVEADSYLVSPVMDLTDREGTTLSFAVGLGFYFPTAANEFYTVGVKEEGASAWTFMDITNFPEKGSGNWSSEWPVNEFDLKAYDGKKIQIAIRYKNDGKASRALEIKDLVVKGTPKASVMEIESDDTTPVYYTLQGVKTTTPEKGIFIKVQNGKATKVMF